MELEKIKQAYPEDVTKKGWFGWGENKKINMLKRENKKKKGKDKKKTYKNKSKLY